MADTFGDRLGAARSLVEGLSARELDRLSGTTEGHAAAVEAGTYSPTIERARRWATSLGVSLDWLVMGQGDAPIAEVVVAAISAARTALEKAKHKAARASKMRSKSRRRSVA